jgi:homoserine kinase
MAVHVRVPATIANFGPAFDAFALAVGLYNEITLDGAGRAEVRIEGEGAGVLPADETNLVYRAAAAVAALAGGPQAFSLSCRNGIPIGRGLGSSAAAIVGGAVAANALGTDLLEPPALLRIASDMEGHPDNAAAALVGGAVVLTRNTSGWVWTRMLPEWDAECVVAVPDFAVATAQARRVLPEQVPLRDAVANVGRTGLLMAAVLTGRVELLGTAMDDALHQPYRAGLVPGMSEVFTAARRAGAFGAALSGSGPAIVAVCPPHLTGTVGAAMVRAFAEAGHSAYYVRVGVDAQGAQVRSSG